MSRVDHWASIRDRSVRPLLDAPIPDLYENATLKVKIGRLTGQIYRLKETLAEKQLEIDFLRGETVNKRVTRAQEILSETIREHDVSIADVMGQSRSRHIAKVRHHVMWRLKKELGMSLDQIGRLLNRDHTTVLYAIRRHDKIRNVLISMEEDAA
jgi:chromosomal replication initiator protein